MRMTKKQLKSKVDRLNIQQGEKLEPLEVIDGVNHWNIGTYSLDWAYGGVKLVRQSNDKGGETNITNNGHVPMRELADQIDAILNFNFNRELQGR